MQKLKNPMTFVLGLTFSLLVTAIAWYWYKSTSAEEGALDLLDRMAATDARLRTAQARLAANETAPAQYITLEKNGASPVKTAVADDDLQRVRGIGPVFAARLQAAGIHTIAALRQTAVTQLATILEVADWRAQAILDEAGRLA
ncbi:MAG: DUF4332 domain-containing protein [Chloroflexi bacterium]|nr:DUF4332 domain-containing protein [Chloroflexota bacterium]